MAKTKREQGEEPTAEARSSAPAAPADTIEPKDAGQRSAESVEVAEENPKADTPDVPEPIMDAVTPADVEKAPVPDQSSVARTLPQMRQHPALTTADEGAAIEVAERTVDLDTTSEAATEGVEGGDKPTTMHVKDFVTTRREYDSEDHDAVHERNFRAVRQYMVNQGLRPDAKVVFMGEEDGPEVRNRPDRRSVILRYGVEAVPVVLADGMELVHTVIDQNGPTATQLATYQAKREERIRASHRALV